MTSVNRATARPHDNPAAFSRNRDAADQGTSEAMTTHASPSIAQAPQESMVAGSWRAWCVALRPKTFWIATIPVIVGSALGLAETGVCDATIALLALIASLLLQAITNLQNDVGYTLRGAETGQRVGLSRATANGWLTPRQVQRAIAGAVLASLVVGSPIIARAGWPAALMGGASIVAAIAYMGGPRPIAFTPFGELTVFVFFGMVAVVGTYFVQTGTVSLGAWLAAAAVGALAAAVLAVNNHRDRAHDATTGRRTFVVTFGARASQALWSALVLLAFALAAGVAAWEGNAWFALPLLTLPLAYSLWRDFRVVPPGPGWNGLLFRTVKLELAFGLLLAAGAVLAASR